MINSKEDYKEYLRADKKALNRKNIMPYFWDYIWKYEIYLRKCEYYKNCKEGIVNRLILKYYIFRKYRLGVKCGFSIPDNVCGKGLSIAHIGPIIINPKAIVGENCRIHVGANIGASYRNSDECPVLGNNIYIAPGVKIYGKVKIGDNIAIGANAVVNKSFEEQGISIAGVPAKKISDKGSIKNNTKEWSK